jgi:hypothetical protein
MPKGKGIVGNSGGRSRLFIESADMVRAFTLPVVGTLAHNKSEPTLISAANSLSARTRDWSVASMARRDFDPGSSMDVLIVEATRATAIRGAPS